MGIFNSLNETSDKAVDVGEEYLKKTQEFYRLKVFKQLTSISGLFFKAVLIGSFLLLSLILLAVAGIVALAEMIGSLVLACLIVAGFLLILGLLSYLLRSKIDEIIIQKMSKKFFS